MKGTEKIIEQINAEAEKKAAALIEEAEARCAEIRADYEKRAREIYTEKIRAGVGAGQQRMEALQTSRLRAGEEELEKARQALIEECFALAAAKVPELSGDEFKARAEKLGPEFRARIASILFD